MKATEKRLKVTDQNVRSVEESGETDLIAFRTNNIAEEAKEYYILKQGMGLAKAHSDAEVSLFIRIFCLNFKCVPPI